MPNKGCKFPPEPLTRAEVEAMAAQCSHRAPTGVRNAAMIVTMYRTGMRIGETLDLRLKDLNRPNQSIRILNGKGGKSRLVGMDGWGWSALDVWLTKRREVGLARKQIIFCTLSGGRMAPPYVTTMLKRLGHKAGIEKRIHSHGLRHSFAQSLLEEGVPIAAISRLLGHESVVTTSSYLQQLGPSFAVKFAIDRS
jgi:integrase/recombinase XerD